MPRHGPRPPCDAVHCWGRGYATEAAAPVLAHALQGLGLDAVVADIDPLNAASIRVAEKLGLVFAEERYLDGALAKSYRLSAGPLSPGS
ncbi:GNAT family N-acetyltransferase [Pelagibius litoralis]|uniref:GNAT family N-acetyltransferase n=1 Tax=Pelagibius litoralis TaxID=374515 RepID=UPI00197E3D18